MTKSKTKTKKIQAGTYFIAGDNILLAKSYTHLTIASYGYKTEGNVKEIIEAGILDCPEKTKKEMLKVYCDYLNSKTKNND